MPRGRGAAHPGGARGPAGVGHETTGVVLCQAFGLPAFPGDTHIDRLAARWGLSIGRNVAQTERDLTALFPEASWAKVHLQIIPLGRRYCPALRHDLAASPICSWAMPARGARWSNRPSEPRGGTGREMPRDGRSPAAQDTGAALAVAQVDTGGHGRGGRATSGRVQPASRASRPSVTRGHVEDSPRRRLAFASPSSPLATLGAFGVPLRRTTRNSQGTRPAQRPGESGITNPCALSVPGRAARVARSHES